MQKSWLEKLNEREKCAQIELVKQGNISELVGGCIIADVFLDIQYLDATKKLL